MGPVTSSVVLAMANRTGQTSGMHAGGIALTVDRPEAASERLTNLQRRDRVFWTGFAAALFVHALLIIGIGSARQRNLGAPDGANDAIAVEIVDGATLKDSMEPPTPQTPPPGTQPQQTAAIPPQPPVQPPPEPEAQPQEEAVPPPPAPETSKPAEAPPTEKLAPDITAENVPALDEATPADALQQMKPQEAPKQDVPKPEAEKQETPKVETKKPPAKQQAKQQQKKRTQTSALDLSVPYDGAATDSDSGSAGSAVQRPPGITRSGENDEFARNVIRALQRTMPRERAHGRVTVRIVLNENGSRADVKLLQGGGDPDLDFNVMFAARQTAYPFPPKNATLVDRTFTVTYIYR